MPVVLFSAALIFTACLLIQCSSGDKTTSHARQYGVTEKTFTSWDNFISSSAGTSPPSSKVVFIGIDGAAWWYLDQLIADGRLPNLARIKNEGAYGTLRSIPSFVSPPAWTTMMTGFLPETSGIYTFGKWDQKAKKFTSVGSDDVCVPFVWDAASQAGRSVSIVNVPVTYPVSEVNGIMVSGMLTPITLTRELKTRRSKHDRRTDYLVQPIPKHYGFSGAAIEDSLNLFLFLLYDTVDDGSMHADSVTLRVLSKHYDDAPDPTLGEYRFATNEYSPWIRIRHNTKEEVKAAFTKVICETAHDGSFDIMPSVNLFPIDVQYTYPASLADELEEKFDYYLPTKFLIPQILPKLTEEAAAYARFFYDYDDWDLNIFVFGQSDNAHHQEGFGETASAVYERIDASIGDIMSSMPPNATLIIASDHGFDTFTYGIDLNQMLAELNLLEWKNKGTIDFERTLVFHNLYHLYFNSDMITRAELARRGLQVPAGTDLIEHVLDFVASQGVRVRSADLSRDFELEFHRVSPGNLSGDPPRMRVRAAYSDYYIEFWNIRKPREGALWKLSGTQKWWHRRDGVFMFWGGNVRRGYDAGVKDIQDIAPTVAFLLGVPIAPDIDGQVIYDALLPEWLSERKAYTVSLYHELHRNIVEDTSDREELLKKLKSLGYVQ